jgi:hypothetical protein
MALLRGEFVSPRNRSYRAVKNEHFKSISKMPTCFSDEKIKTPFLLAKNFHVFQNNSATYI